MRKTIAILIALFCLGSTFSFAAQHTFFGEDLNTNQANVDPTWFDPEWYRIPGNEHQTADGKRDEFLSYLIDVGTESFDNSPATIVGPSYQIPAQTPPLTVSFLTPAGVAYADATLGDPALPSGFVATPQVFDPSTVPPTPTTDIDGRYPISGNNFWYSGVNFSIRFSDAVAAFGFYGVDIGDFRGGLDLEFIPADSSVQPTTYTVPFTPENAGGSVAYVGFIDDTNPFTQVNFVYTDPLGVGAGADIFGFDDFTIGTLQQLVDPSESPPVPEPATLFLLGPAAIALVGFRRKSKRSPK
jgi:hypothetical protein